MGRGRRARVRNRLVVAVAVVAAATAAASAPGLIDASGRLSDAQALLDDARRTQRALTLAHALADESQAVTAYVAAGRPHGRAPADTHSVPVDRRIAELRADDDAPAALRRDLDRVAGVRKSALSGKSSALTVHQAYADVILALHHLAEDLADRMPPEATRGGHALAGLDTAVEQAEATRGLLLAALAVPGATGTTTVIDPATGLPRTVPNEPASATRQRNELSAAAQQARLRETAELAGFRDRASDAYRSTYDTTVTGPDVTAAEKALARLTDQPTLSDDDRDTDAEKLAGTLTARIDVMRSAEASLNVDRIKELAGLRDDAVTALEIRVALAGVCLLLGVGIVMAMARGLTRPLAVLRLGTARLAADPVAAEPIRFTGRNDEFAQVLRSVNALHAHAVELHAQAHGAAADGTPAGGSQRAVAREDAHVAEDVAETAADEEAVDGAEEGGGQRTLVNLGLRTLGLVERQLAVIEKLEEQEDDPDRLATLFRLDHFATVMRRHSENLLVLAGADRGHQHAGPVPLIDVVRAAVSEVEHYTRIHVAALPAQPHIAGLAADDLSHLLAELMENATSCSPPDATVEVSGWLLESGDVMLSVADQGIGMAPERLTGINAELARLVSSAQATRSTGDLAAGPDTPDGLGLGLYVVARLAQRHGVRVRLREQQQGGIAAVVWVPRSALGESGAGVVAPPSEVRVVGGPAAAQQGPGAATEANSPVLPGRGLADSLIAAAESALADAASQGEPAASGPHQAAASAPGHARTEPAGPAGPEQGAPAGAQPTGHRSPTRHEAPLTPDHPINPYAIGPDAHERTRDAAAPTAPQDPAAAPGAPGTAAPQRLTAKGLPKRTPRIAPQAGEPMERTGGVDAQELRRRLGGFQQGARAGRQDAEADPATAPAGSYDDPTPAGRPATGPTTPRPASSTRTPRRASDAPTTPPAVPHPRAPQHPLTTTTTTRQNRHDGPAHAARPVADAQGDTVEEASS
ncbi:sensor histidine kinase [Streptomyces odontomachi]|uniref:sensor histidine kinase n=1 Tax=Streptomyces odontomachi TaxID=2944940 RepID=UPI0035A91E80